MFLTQPQAFYGGVSKSLLSGLIVFNAAFSPCYWSFKSGRIPRRTLLSPMQPVDLGALVSHPGTENSLGGAVLPGLPNAMTNVVSLPCRVSLPESHHFWG